MPFSGAFWTRVGWCKRSRPGWDGGVNRPPVLLSNKIQSPTGINKFPVQQVTMHRWVPMTSKGPILREVPTLNSLKNLKSTFWTLGYLPLNWVACLSRGCPSKRLLIPFRLPPFNFPRIASQWDADRQTAGTRGLFLIRRDFLRTPTLIYIN